MVPLFSIYALGNVESFNDNNNNHIFGRNGTYVQNIYIKFIFTALSYQASAEQFNSKSYSDKIKTIYKIYIYSGIFISIWNIYFKSFHRISVFFHFFFLCVVLFVNLSSMKHSFVAETLKVISW